MLHGAAPFPALLVSTQQMSLLTEPKQPPHFQRLHQGLDCLLLGQPWQERQPLQAPAQGTDDGVESQLGGLWGDTGRGPTAPAVPKASPPPLLHSCQDQITPLQREGPWDAWRWERPSLPSHPLPAPSALGPRGRVQTPVLALAGSGVGPHLPQEGQVPGEGALIQGVIFREEDPWALGKEARKRSGGF